MVNSKKKGNRFENIFANWLTKNGIKAWKDGASGGGNNEKGDVGNGLNLHIEVKAVKGINLFKVWKKALLECQKTHNDPLLAIHFDSMAEEDFLIVISNDTWLDLIQKSKGGTFSTEPTLNYSQRSAMESLKRSLSLVKKEFEIE